MWRHIHAVLMVAWFAAVIPTVLWWRDSVMWVALMSCWANGAAHFSAWQGARAEENDDGDEDQARLERKVDALVENAVQHHLLERELHTKVAKLHRRWGGAPDDL